MPLKISKKYLLLISIALFVSFVFFSYLVAREKFTRFDFDMTVKFQDRIPPVLDYPFSTLSVLGSAEVSMSIWLIVAVFLFLRRFFLASITQILLPIALVLEIFGKVFIYHPAPPHLFYRGVISFNFPSSFVHTEYSYPSGHMTRAAFVITFLMIYLYLRHGFKVQLILQPILLGLYIAMAVSRIYLGEHWTTDVVGGALIGSSFGLMSALFIPYKKRYLSSIHTEEIDGK